MGLPCCREGHGEVRFGKAVVLAGLSLEGAPGVHRTQGGEHCIAGGVIQMIGRVFRQRPAVVCIIQRVGLAVVGDINLGQIAGRHRRQRDAALGCRVGGFFQHGLGAVHGPEGTAQQNGQNHQHRKGALFCFHIGLLTCGGAAARLQHLLPAPRPAAGTRTPCPVRWTQTRGL